MNRKGFTLIEVVLVIALIGILSLIIIPNIQDTVDNGKIKAYNSLITSVRSAADLFISDNRYTDIGIDCSNNREKSTACLPLNTLIDGGYLSNGKVVNPINSEKIDLGESVAISFNCRTKEYSYVYRDKITEDNGTSNYDDSLCDPSVEFFFNDKENTNVLGKNNWYITPVDLIIKPRKVNEYSYYIKSSLGITSLVSASGETEVLLTENATNNQLCVVNDNGSDFCSDTYNINTKKPNNPEIKLVDNVVYFSDIDSDVDYYYSVNDSAYMVGNNIKIATNSKISAYAVNKSGSKSEVVEKSVFVTELKKNDIEVKYYCSNTNSYQTASDCSNSSNILIKYLCPNGSYSDDPACTYDLDTVTTDYISYCDYNSCSWNINNTDENTSSCTSSNNFSTCNIGNKGITKTTCELGDVKCYSNSFTCSKKEGTSCTKATSKCWYAKNKATYKKTDSTCGCQGNNYGSLTCESGCYYWFNFCDIGYTRVTKEYSTCGDYFGACVSDAKCQIVRKMTCTASGEKKYYCSKTRNYYNDITSAETVCFSSIVGDKKYYCGINEKYYSDEATAKSECKNICLNGSVFENKCYILK